MEKLKTLKDLVIGDFVWADDIKGEAIKLIKKYQHDHSEFSRGRQNSLIFFFNIRDGELG